MQQLRSFKEQKTDAWGEGHVMMGQTLDSGHQSWERPDRILPQPQKDQPTNT